VERIISPWLGGIDAGAASDILQRHRFEQRRFSSARFSDYINMGKSGLVLETKRSFIALERAASEFDMIVGLL
jgi:hypothetical protein